VDGSSGSAASSLISGNGSLDFLPFLEPVFESTDFGDLRDSGPVDSPFNDRFELDFSLSPSLSECLDDDRFLGVPCLRELFDDARSRRSPLRDWRLDDRSRLSSGDATWSTPARSSVLAIASTRACKARWVSLSGILSPLFLLVERSFGPRLSERLGLVASALSLKNFLLLFFSPLVLLLFLSDTSPSTPFLAELGSSGSSSTGLVVCRMCKGGGISRFLDGSLNFDGRGISSCFSEFDLDSGGLSTLLLEFDLDNGGFASMLMSVERDGDVVSSRPDED
jgi:hypothetical protein